MRAALVALTLALGACAGATPAPTPPVPVAAPAAPPPAPAGTPLAVTIDDLPFVGDLSPGDSAEAAVARILAAVEGVPVTGFFVCGRGAGRDAAWGAWMASPIEVGNHTGSHRAIDDFDSLDAWRRDVSGCQRVLERDAGAREVRHFRYPFLRTGRERARRDAGFAILEELGLTRAPVTIDTSEWALVGPYAPTRDPEVAAAYVDHVRRAARRYRALAEARGTPGAPQVLLIHANALAADHLGDLLEALREDGFRFVSLDEALADPLYAETDHYVGGVGMSWLYRVEDHADAWAWDAAQLHAMQVRFRGATERRRFDLDRGVSIERERQGAWRIDEADRVAHLVRRSDGTLAIDAPPSGPLLDWAATRFGAAPVVTTE